MTGIWEALIDILNLNIPTNPQNPFEFIWLMWLDIYDLMTTFIQVYLVTFKIPILNIETSLYELTFGVGLLVFLILSVLATIHKVVSDWV